MFSLVTGSLFVVGLNPFDTQNNMCLLPCFFDQVWNALNITIRGGWNHYFKPPLAVVFKPPQKETSRVNNPCGKKLSSFAKSLEVMFRPESLSLQSCLKPPKRDLNICARVWTPYIGDGHPTLNTEWATNDHSLLCGNKWELIHPRIYTQLHMERVIGLPDHFPYEGL